MQATPLAAEPDAAAVGGHPQGESACDSIETLSGWRDSGEDRFDPVRFRYLESLARRANAHHGAVRTTLERKLLDAIAIYETRRRQALDEAGAIGKQLALRFPDASAEIDRLADSADRRGLRRLAEQLESRCGVSPLADLLRRIDASSAPASAADQSASVSAAAPASRFELRSFTAGRSTWVRIGIDQQLQRSLASAPLNPGPFNSHQLVLRALQCMQAISPACLQHFVSYVDTLAWLDQASHVAAPARRPPRRSSEPRQGRGRSR